MRSRRAGVLDGLLVGEDDGLLLMTLDPALTIDPVKLQEDVERTVGHVRLLV
jgi:hypothetical protein